MARKLRLDRTRRRLGTAALAAAQPERAPFYPDGAWNRAWDPSRRWRVGKNGTYFPLEGA